MKTDHCKCLTKLRDSEPSVYVVIYERGSHWYSHHPAIYTNNQYHFGVLEEEIWEYKVVTAEGVIRYHDIGIC